MAGTTGLEPAASAVTVSVVRFYKNLEDRGDCQSTPKSSKASHFVGWVVGWKLARSSEEFASAYATRAEHFLDGLWLDSWRILYPLFHLAGSSHSFFVSTRLLLLYFSCSSRSACSHSSK